MHDTELLILILLVAFPALSVLARAIDMPYPILLVLGGLLLGFVPGLPAPELEPDLVLVIFLPPLLYVAAFFADLRDLRANLRPISLLVGRARAVDRGARSPWSRACCSTAVGGGVRARRHPRPDRPDRRDGDHAAARGAAPAGQRHRGREPGQRRHRARRLPRGGRCGDRRVVLALARRRSSSSSASPAASLVGLAVGWLVAEVRARVDDVPTEVTISLFTGYAAYLPAEQLHVSGVLAAVTAGI